MIQIESMRDQARREGVVDADNLPFFIPSQGPEPAAVLLVHGFTASPWEMRTVAGTLNHAGFACLGLRLPGHGTTAEDLAGKTLEMWQAEVAQGVRLLKQAYPRVYGVGLSSGALLLLEPAARGDLRGTVLLSPYLELGHWLSPWTGLLRFFVRFQRRELTAEAARHYYAERPVAGIYQLRRLIRRSRRRLPEVRVPTLVLSAAGDQTINPDSSRELYRLLGSPAKHFHQYGAEVPHVLTTADNPHLEDTLARVSGFLTGLEAARQAAPEPA